MKHGVAVIGAGNRGASLAQAAVGSFDIRVVCDLNEQAAAKLAASLHANDSVTDYRDAITRDDVDAVLVTLPQGLHREVTVAAAQSGKHVFCEKPLAVSLEDGNAMVDACRAANVALMVGYQFRFAAERLKLRDLLQGGAIGRPVMWREALPVYGESQRWLYDGTLGGGAMFEYSHSIDFACYTLGKPIGVSAKLFRFRETDEGDSHDTYDCRITFDSGDAYHISGFGMLPPDRDMAQRFGGDQRVRTNDIVGPEGAIYAGADENGDTSLVVAEHVGSSKQRVAAHPWQGWGGYIADPTPAMVDDFADAIRTGDFNKRNSGDQALQTLTILQAAIESSETGRTVTLG